MGVETELKLTAGPAFILPRLDGLRPGVAQGPDSEVRLETTYYDTEDLRLTRWGAGLRHRPGEGWTLKLPTSGATPEGTLSRPEITVAGHGEEPPPELAGLVRVIVLGRPLQQVARLSTWRHRVALVDADGAVLVEVADDDVSVMQGEKVEQRFRELEAELKAPEAADLLQEVRLRLVLAGAQPGDPLPKHARALGPRALAAPPVAANRLRRDSTLDEAIRWAFATQVREFLHQDVQVRLNWQADPIHRARVAARALRSHLRTFRPYLDAAWAQALDEEIGWIADELGRVRDLQVLGERLQAQLPLMGEAGPESDALLERIAGQTQAARLRLEASLENDRYLRLAGRLEEMANRPQVGPKAKSLARLALPRLRRSAWRHAVRYASAMGSAAASSSLHRLRILVKRARHAAEVSSALEGARARGAGRRLAALQALLGEQQEAARAAAWLANVRGPEGFLAGRMYEREKRLEAKLTRRAPRAWQETAERIERLTD